MLTLRGTTDLKGRLEFEDVAFRTHDNPHLDEIGALWLIEKFCTKEFLEKYAKNKMILVGIGGGDFDEHPMAGQERKNGDCAMSLVAKALGVEKDPALEKILKFITNNDLKGSSHPFDLASLLSARYQCSCNGAPEKVIRATINDLETFYELQRRFFACAKADFEKKATIDVVKNGDRELKIVSIDSDDPQISKFARSSHGCDAAVVIQKKTSGHIQIFTNKRHGVMLFDMAQMIRVAEQKAKGAILVRDWKTLSSEGAIEGVPEWYFHREGQMLLNGSLTNTDVAPTHLSVKRIRSFVQIALDHQNYPQSHAVECKRGICTSTFNNPCEFYPYGLHRCRKIRYQMKTI